MRTLVVGTGSIGLRHCRNLVALGHDVLAWDTDARRLAEAAALAGVLPVSSLDDGLDRRPDAAVVCTPPADHLAVAWRALGAGAHLFVEKPISHTSEGVSELIDEAKRQDRVLALGFNLRHLPSLCRVRSLLEAGRVGRVLAVRAECGSYLPRWRPGRDYRDNYAVSEAMGGGVLLDAIHELDYLGWLFGEVERVFCAAGHLSSLAGDTEDIAQVTLRFESGILAQVHLDYVQRAYRRSLQVIGEDGVILWDHPTHTVTLHGAGSGEARAELVDDGDVNAMYLSELRHFGQSVLGGLPAAADGRDGLRALRLVEAAKRSVRAGGAWLRPATP